ncbi:MAG: RNA 2',3'-cyclic phosphodiesterase [Clostridia bacterium]|nr:RNA 2',3'-cyclic phosphodiesterase [Clostridia bacterium]
MPRNLTPLRCFAAVRIEEEPRQAIAAWQEELRSTGLDARWVAPAQLHLTLKFFGDLQRSTVEALARALGEAMDRQRPFHITLRGAGAFPNLKRPRVLWVGVGQGAPALAALAAVVEEVARGLGVPFDARPFEPHLTVARLRDGAAPVALPAAFTDAARRSWGEQVVRDVRLIHSTLTPEGPVYRDLGRFKLEAR